MLAKKKAVKSKSKSNVKPSKAPAKKASAKKAPAKTAAAKKTAAKKTAAKIAKKPAKKVAPKAAKPVKATTSKAKGSLKKAAQILGAAAGVTIAGVALSKVAAASKSSTDVTALFSPLDDRLIIEEVKIELRTPGGLFIPDTVAAPEGPKHGKVLAVGRGHTTKKGHFRPLDVKLGDTVLFESYMGQPLKIGDRDVLVLRESQLLGLASS